MEHPITIESYTGIQIYRPVCYYSIQYYKPKPWEIVLLVLSRGLLLLLGASFLGLLAAGLSLLLVRMTPAPQAGFLVGAGTTYIMIQGTHR
jgi:hypothetical protein